MIQRLADVCSAGHLGCVGGPDGPSGPALGCCRADAEQALDLWQVS
jgi:hypothetical protein